MDGAKQVSKSAKHAGRRSPWEIPPWPSGRGSPEHPDLAKMAKTRMDESTLILRTYYINTPPPWYNPERLHKRVRLDNATVRFDSIMQDHRTLHVCS